MKNIIRFPDTRRIDEEAAQWLVRLDGSELAQDEHGALEAWLQRDDRHGAALRRLGEVWGQMDCLTALAPLFPLNDTAAAQPTMQPRRRQMLALAASVLVGVAVVLAAVKVWNPFWGQPEQIYYTDIGQRTDVVLADGSVLTLNTDSRVGVRFGADERAVHLIRGEALFKVAKNPKVPFVVHAGSGSVRAIGTAFAVRLRDQEQVDVTVSEGVVQVAASQALDDAAKAGSTHTVILRQGGSATYRQAIEAVTELSPQQLDARLGWRSGKWIFDGETLADAVAEVNRYSNRRIEIVDPRIADVRVGGYFDIGDIEPLLAALEHGFGIRVTRVDADRVQLSRRDDAGQ